MTTTMTLAQLFALVKDITIVTALVLILYGGWKQFWVWFGAKLTPSDAYRFARGEELLSNTGQRVKLSRPLDFLVVADHSDNMGLYTDLAAGKPELIANPKGRRWYDMIQSGKGGDAALEMIFSFGDGSFPKEMIYQPNTSAYREAWQGEIKAAEEYNDPGRFTAFIGFEWTSNAQANNLHRNVIFRGNGAQASQVVPMVTFKPFGSDNPADLWKWMAATEEKTGAARSHRGRPRFRWIFAFRSRSIPPHLVSIAPIRHQILYCARKSAGEWNDLHFFR